MAKNLKHSVLIDQHYFEVWETLTKLHEYANWNNLFFAAKGLLIEGHEIKIRLKVSSKAIQAYNAKMEKTYPDISKENSKHHSIPSNYNRFKITSLKNLSHFTLTNKTLFGWLTKIVITFQLEDINDLKTRFTIKSSFSGLVIDLLGIHIVSLYDIMLEEMANGLKEYMENGQSPIEFAEEAYG